MNYYRNEIVEQFEKNTPLVSEIKNATHALFNKAQFLLNHYSTEIRTLYTQDRGLIFTKTDNQIKVFENFSKISQTDFDKEVQSLPHKDMDRFNFYYRLIFHFETDRFQNQSNDEIFKSLKKIPHKDSHYDRILSLFSRYFTEYIDLPEEKKDPHYLSKRFTDFVDCSNNISSLYHYNQTLYEHKLLNHPIEESIYQDLSASFSESAERMLDTTDLINSLHFLYKGSQFLNYHPKKKGKFNDGDDFIWIQNHHDLILEDQSVFFICRPDHSQNPSLDDFKVYFINKNDESFQKGYRRINENSFWIYDLVLEVKNNHITYASNHLLWLLETHADYFKNYLTDNGLSLDQIHSIETKQILDDSIPKNESYSKRPKI
jgi:ribosomal protein S17E